MSKIIKIADRRPKDCMRQLKDLVDAHVEQNVKVKAAVVVLHKESGPLAFHMTGEYDTLEMIGVLRLLERDLESGFVSEPVSEDPPEPSGTA